MIKLFQELSRAQPAPITSVRLEVSSTCQLKCPLCPTGKGETRRGGAIGWGHLTLERFQHFLEHHPDIKEIELTNWGEMFLNPEVLGILQSAHRHGVALTAMNGVNLNTASDEVLEALVKYQFRALSVSIDGASQGTYVIYRRNGNFDTVIRNVERINAYKRQYRSPYPKLQWQFIIFGHNEHELPQARAMARRLNMAFRPKVNWTPNYSPIRNRAFVGEVIGEKIGSLYRLIKMTMTREERAFGGCRLLWEQPQINWDGKVLGCYGNLWGDYGNVFEDGLEKCLTSEKYQYAKGMLKGENRPRQDIPCWSCNVYRTNIYPAYAHKFFLRGGLSNLRFLVTVLAHIAEKVLYTMRIHGWAALSRRSTSEHATNGLGGGEHAPKPEVLDASRWSKATGETGPGAGGGEGAWEDVTSRARKE